MHTWHTYHSTKAFQIKKKSVYTSKYNITITSMMEALWNSCSSLPLDYLDLKLLGSPLSAVQRLRGRDTTSEPSSGSTRFLQIRTGHAGSTKEFLFNFSCVQFHWFLKGMNWMVGIFFWPTEPFLSHWVHFSQRSHDPFPLTVVAAYCDICNPVALRWSNWETYRWWRSCEPVDTKPLQKNYFEMSTGSIKRFSGKRTCAM